MHAWAGKVLGMAFLAVVLTAVPRHAQAQYRNNGIYFEGGAQTFEFAPYTVGAFALSRGVYEAGGAVEKAGGPARPARLKHCGQLKPYMFPCINNWFGLTDGVYVGAGFQRVLGDLLLDLSEVPLLRNIVFAYGARLGAAGTLAGGGKMLPVFIVHQDFSVRWNILDEKIRPYVGMGFGFNLFVDPFGLAGRVSSNRAQCARNETNVGADSLNGGCVDGAGTTLSLNAVNPQAALFYISSFPVLLSFPRPEVGLEYFFMEDISVQGFVSPAIYGTLLPQFILRPPFVGFSLRAGANVVFYF
jgi:hypothetical protein